MNVTALAAVPRSRTPHLSMQDLADRLNVPIQTVRQWRVYGKGPRGMKIGRHVRYRLEDVIDWEESLFDPSGAA